MSRARTAHTAAEYARAAAEGLTAPQCAARFGVNRITVYKAAKRHGITFAACERPSSLLRRLSQAQRDDVQTLMQLGDYSMQEAIDIVTRPKRRIRAPQQVTR